MRAELMNSNAEKLAHLADIAQLATQVETLNAEKLQAVQNLETTRSEQANCEERAKNLHGKNETLTTQVEALNAEKLVYLADIAQLSNQVETVSAEKLQVVQNLEDTRKELATERATTDGLLQQCNNSIEQLRQDHIAELNTQNNLVQTQREELKQSGTEKLVYLADVARLADHTSELQTRAIDTEGRLQNCNAQYSEMKKVQNEKVAEITLLKGQSHDHLQDVGTIQVELDKKKTELEQLRAELTSGVSPRKRKRQRMITGGGKDWVRLFRGVLGDGMSVKAHEDGVLVLGGGAEFYMRPLPRNVYQFSDPLVGDVVQLVWVNSADSLPLVRKLGKLLGASHVVKRDLPTDPVFFRDAMTSVPARHKQGSEWLDMKMLVSVLGK